MKYGDKQHKLLQKVLAENPKGISVSKAMSLVNHLDREMKRKKNHV